MSQEDIMKQLKKEKEPITGKEIAKKIKVGLNSTNKALKSLRQSKGIKYTIKKREGNKGNASYYYWI